MYLFELCMSKKYLNNFVVSICVLGIYIYNNNSHCRELRRNFSSLFCIVYIFREKRFCINICYKNGVFMMKYKTYCKICF